MEEGTVTRRPGNHAAFGLSRLMQALRRAKHGHPVTSFRFRSNRLRLADIDIMSIKGHTSQGEKYRTLDQRAPCRILIVDAGVHDRIYMDIDSLAFLLDAAIASDPGHFLRRTGAKKDSDE